MIEQEVFGELEYSDKSIEVYFIALSKPLIRYRLYKRIFSSNNILYKYLSIYVKKPTIKSIKVSISTFLIQIIESTAKN